MVKEKSNWFVRSFWNYLEFILVFIISIAITFAVYKYSYNSFTTSYIASGVNGILIELFGGLLGLLLTAYAIIFGIIPHLTKDLLDSTSFDKINWLFLLSILFTISLLLITITLQFKGIELLIITGLFFFILNISIILILSIILFLLLKITRNKLIKKN